MGERSFGEALPEPVSIAEVNENYQVDASLGVDWLFRRLAMFAGALLLVDVALAVACLVLAFG